MRKFITLLLAVFTTHTVCAQIYFNKLATLNASHSYISSVHEDGNYYVTLGYCHDSLTGLPAVKFAHFDKSGNVLFDTGYQQINKPSIGIIPVMHPYRDGYVFAATMYSHVSPFGLSSTFLYHVNSAGQVLKVAEIEKPVCTGNNQMQIADIKLVENGSWLVLSEVLCASGSNYAADMLLTKVDSNFNVIWHKQYGGNDAEMPGRLLIETNSYLIAGSYQSGNTYRAMLTRTDTAGNVQWQWMSNAGNAVGKVTDVIRTNGGGYVYCGNGVTGSAWPNGNDRNGWVGKVDANGNELWGKEFKDHHHNTILNRVMERADGSLTVVGTRGEGGDSSTMVGWFLRLNADGDILFDRRYKGFAVGYSSSTFFDAIPTADGGYLMAGGSSSLSAQPIQQSWLLKVDSNGCEDPNCWPLDVAPLTYKTDEIIVYPNPAHDVLNVDISGNADFKLMDVAGRVVRQQKVNGNAVININDLSAGIYIYTIETAGGKKTTGKVRVE